MKTNRSRALLALLLVVAFAGVLHAATVAQGNHPGYQQDHGVVLPSHAAATATESIVIYEAERACRLKKVDFYASAAVTGDDTNRTNLNVLVNATEKGNYDLATGSDLTANTKKNLYTPTTPLALAAGDRVILQFEKVASGVLVPHSYARVVIDFEP